MLLATMWYVTSCWIFSSSCISQIQRLIRNFLWSGKNGDATRAKVAWPVITLPTSHRGLLILLVTVVRSLASLWCADYCPTQSPGRSFSSIDFRDALQSLGGALATGHHMDFYRDASCWLLALSRGPVCMLHFEDLGDALSCSFSNSPYGSGYMLTTAPSLEPPNLHS